jgi:hypothetical protein
MQSKGEEQRSEKWWAWVTGRSSGRARAGKSKGEKRSEKWSAWVDGRLFAGLMQGKSRD